MSVPPEDPSTSPSSVSALSSSFSQQLSLGGRYGLWEERDRIHARKSALQRETCDLAFTHYPTFISAAECCKDISKDFGAVQGQLESLEKKVPNLLETCQKFREKTAQVRQRQAVLCGAL